jgi:NADH:ubiquinone oxidoreductase subunit F (NADH-binding)
MAKVNIINNSLQERRGPTGHVTVVEVIDEGKIQKDHVSKMLAAGISLLGRGKTFCAHGQTHTQDRQPHRQSLVPEVH